MWPFRNWKTEAGMLWKEVALINGRISRIDERILNGLEHAPELIKELKINSELREKQQERKS